jgi:NAD(P) transhydrogenase subunit alpha
MIFDAVDMVFIFVLAVFLGFEVISKVPSILHTPLMSGSNAIHGVILVGSMVIASQASGALQTALALIAVFLATLNIVGGVVVTDRMLDMFKGRQQTRQATPAGGEAGSAATSTAPSEDGKRRPKP